MTDRALIEHQQSEMLKALLHGDSGDSRVYDTAAALRRKRLSSLACHAPAVARCLTTEQWDDWCSTNPLLADDRADVLRLQTSSHFDAVAQIELATATARWKLRNGEVKTRRFGFAVTQRKLAIIHAPLLGTVILPLR